MTRAPRTTAGFVAGLLALPVLLAGCGTGRSGPAAAPARPSGGGASSSAAAAADLAAARSRAALAPCPVSVPVGAGAAPPRTGDTLPGLTLPCLGAGPDVRLAAPPGVPMVVNVWASWCLSCREEMRAFQRLADRAGTRLRVLGVDSEDPPMTDSLAFLSTLKVRFPSVYDVHGSLRIARRLPGLPFTVFVRADGRVAGTHAGELDDAGLAAAVRQWLGVTVDG